MIFFRVFDDTTSLTGGHSQPNFLKATRDFALIESLYFSSRLIVRLERWRDSTTEKGNGDAPVEKPDFPLLPVSKGFCISLSKALKQFRNALRAAEMYGVGDLAPAAQKEKGSESEAQK